MKPIQFRIPLVLMTLAVAFASGCASGPKTIDYPATASAPDEVYSLNHDLVAAQNNQVDALSPKNFSNAWAALTDAQSKLSKGKDRADVLRDVSRGRAYLNEANRVAQAEGPLMPEVIQARADAVKANARTQDAVEFNKADKDLRSIGSDIEGGKNSVAMDDRKDLQGRFLNTELNAIKNQNIGDARRMIEQAKKNNAEKTAPRTLAQAEEKYAAADTAIATDRHNSALISEKSGEANTEAARLLKIMGMARQDRVKTPEEIALETESKNNTIAEKTAEEKAKEAQYAQSLTRKEQDLQARDQALQTKEQQIAVATSSNQELEKRQQFDMAFTNAQKLFKPSEAEVYKEGDHLTIRLKGLNFTSGKADLPAENLPLLSKVKQAISELNGDRVEVDGHTDAIGSKEANEKLSKKRADAVASYLVSENVVAQDKISTEGYGFEKPIASNKTKMGRAQNRRVDVIVTPKAISGDAKSPAQPSVGN